MISLVLAAHAKLKQIETRKRELARAVTAVGGTIIVAGVLGCAAGSSSPPVSESATSAAPEFVSEGGPARLRLMDQNQYANTLGYIFGPDLKLASRFPPAPRIKGLLALGSAVTGVTPSAVDQFHRNAYAVGAQVVDESHRNYLIPCTPASHKQADTACATQFLRKTGRLLYRRPLTSEELQFFVATADQVAVKLGDFYDGLSFALGGMLASPGFLFFVEKSEADPAHPGTQRLDAYSLASRLSLLLWDSAPDDALLQAAERGELHKREGLRHQVDRMLASPRLEQGMRAFFRDMLAFDSFANLAKDPVIYPAFNAQAATDAQEQALRILVDHLIAQKGDYRDLFTSQTTFLTPALGTLYRMPVASKEWTRYEFPADSPRAGFLTQIGFLSLYAHPGRSSATRRGRALRELILCQVVPDPPPNVDFSIVEDPHAKFTTARERIAAHSTDPTCAGCHRLTDPLGLALENFDGAGQFRSTEGGATIDASGELDGIKYDSPAGLGKAVHDNPATAACLVNRLYSYGVGRPTTRNDRNLLAYFGERFEADGYRVPDLMRTIATSDAFSRIAVAKVVSAERQNAAPSTLPTLAVQH